MKKQIDKTRPSITLILGENEKQEHKDILIEFDRIINETNSIKKYEILKAIRTYNLKERNYELHN
jgi:hypothetical protein